MIDGAERAVRPLRDASAWSSPAAALGSSLALVCAVKGYRFVPVSSDAFAKEKLDTMRRSGPICSVVDSDGGRITPAICSCACAPPSSACAEELGHVTGPISSTTRTRSRDTWALDASCVEQTGGAVHAFCGAVGHWRHAGGRVRRRCKAAGCAARIVALEPRVVADADGGKRRSASRRSWIAPGFVPPHLTAGVYDEARAVPEDRSTRDGSPSRTRRGHIRRHVDPPSTSWQQSNWRASSDRGKWSRRLQWTAG